jgi:hypothetical protein
MKMNIAKNARQNIDIINKIKNPQKRRHQTGMSVRTLVRHTV